MGHESVIEKTLFPPPVPFWFERDSHFRSFNITTLLQIQMFSPYRLSGTHPAYGCQKGTPLAIDTPRLAALRYVVRAALDSGSWIHRVTPVVHSFYTARRENNFCKRLRVALQ